MAGKALEAVKGVLRRIPFLKAPWEIAGPAASVEYQNPTPVATEYRKRSPGSPAQRARVPQATPDTVYDIAYYNRDVIREGQVVGGTNRKRMVTYMIDPHEKDDKLLALEVPPTLGKPTRWSKPVGLLEYENNGYT